MEIKKDEGYRTRSMTIDKTENLINFNIHSVLKDDESNFYDMDINLTTDDVKKLIKFLHELTE
jgi:hypothetical protein